MNVTFFGNITKINFQIYFVVILVFKWIVMPVVLLIKSLENKKSPLVQLNETFAYSLRPKIMGI